MVDELVDPRRTEPAFVAGERESLEQWLDYHRITLVLKCEGLTDAQRKARPVATSLLSLHGILRHMADVERGWFIRCLGRDPEVPPIFYDPEIDDSELVPLDDASWPDDLAVFLAECDAARAAAAARGLGDTGLRRGEEVSLRWIYLHMIEEYARHNGHADLLRELADGAVGC